MRRVTTAGVAVLLTAALLPIGAPAPATSDTLTAEQWRPRVRAARTYAESRSGSVSFAAVDTSGDIYGYRMRTRVPAASVLKVMFMVAYLRHSSVRDRRLREYDRDLLRPMIIRSDNNTATTIANFLGPRKMYRLARRANMRDFSYTRPWGLSTTSARDQARFLFRLRRYIPERHEEYALTLLTRIVDSQRWGIGRVETPGWTKHFKGGWGSGTGAVDHQVVRLRDRPRVRVGLAVMTTSSPSHRYGKRTLRGVFSRLLSNLP